MFGFSRCSVISVFQQQVLHSVSNLHLLLSTLQVRLLLYNVYMCSRSKLKDATLWSFFFAFIVNTAKYKMTQSICPVALVVSVPGSGGPAGQFHRGSAAGPEWALLLLHIFIAADLEAQLADWTRKAAQPGEAAAGASLPAETADSSCWGEEEKGERMGAEGTASDWEGGSGAHAGNNASFSMRFMY